MGELATPTAAELEAAFADAAAIAEAVRKDEDTPAATYPNGDAMPDETRMFRLAQALEITAAESMLMLEVMVEASGLLERARRGRNVSIREIRERLGPVVDRALAGRHGAS